MDNDDKPKSKKPKQANLLTEYLTNQTVIFNKELGTRLQFIMRRRGDTQTTFAALLGVSQAQVSAVFNGKATFLRKKSVGDYVTSNELRGKLGHKAWRYLNSNIGAEEFAPYRYGYINKWGHPISSPFPKPEEDDKS